MRNRIFLRDKHGEPVVWLAYHKRKDSKYHRARIFLPHNSLSFEWAWFESKLAAHIEFDDTDDDCITVHIAIPFILSLFFSIARWDWFMKVTGLKWHKGKPMIDWQRKLGFSWFDKSLIVYPWVNPDCSERGRRNTFIIDPARIILGTGTSSRLNQKSMDGFVVMPEGAYPCKVTLFTSEWKRPRWPFPTRIDRAEVEVEGGVPIPGDGDNDWDMDDDAIFSIITTASNSREATHQFYESVMRQRMKAASAMWKPDGGWPDHCLAEWQIEKQND